MLKYSDRYLTRCWIVGGSSLCCLSFRPFCCVYLWEDSAFDFSDVSRLWRLLSYWTVSRVVKFPFPRELALPAMSVHRCITFHSCTNSHFRQYKKSSTPKKSFFFLRWNAVIITTSARWHACPAIRNRQYSKYRKYSAKEKKLMASWNYTNHMQKQKKRSATIWTLNTSRIYLPSARKPCPSHACPG